MKVTMQDVALEAGVDKATVSRVLKGDHRISENTRVKVMSAVRALNYRLDKNARNLSTNRSGLIGVVVRDFTAEWFPQFMSGLDRTISNSEYEIVLKRTEGNPFRAAREYGKLMDRSVEGIIWTDGEHFPEEPAAPVVAIGFRKTGSYSMVWESECDKPTFEAGALAGRLLLNIITGKPVPSKEIVIKSLCNGDNI
ncbi:MAG: LacI family DNA-binding transcriptional regulator [Synergistaceae bacterium]|nr:LacI family DNA-binding transcriptional regulator [Synergistaceae bacterium]